jgi:hypothetical protein
MNVVKLTLCEMLMACVVGITRNLHNIKDKTPHAYGANDSNNWQINIEGALAECALAKALNVFWSSGKKRAPDVGIDDCRCTPCESGHLIIHREDDSKRKYYLLTGRNGKYNIRGWMRGEDAQDEKYWGDKANNNRPAFFVPQSDLRPFEKPEEACG